METNCLFLVSGGDVHFSSIQVSESTLTNVQLSKLITFLFIHLFPTLPILLFLVCFPIFQSATSQL